jgi:hypothetical protein
MLLLLSNHAMYAFELLAPASLLPCCQYAEMQRDMIAAVCMMRKLYIQGSAVELACLNSMQPRLLTERSFT